MDLQERKVSYGSAGFALQFMLDSKLSDVEKYPLKISDLIVTSIDTELAPERYVWAKSRSVLGFKCTQCGLCWRTVLQAF